MDIYLIYSFAKVSKHLLSLYKRILLTNFIPQYYESKKQFLIVVLKPNPKKNQFKLQACQINGSKTTEITSKLHTKFHETFPSKSKSFDWNFGDIFYRNIGSITRDATAVGQFVSLGEQFMARAHVLAGKIKII